MGAITGAAVGLAQAISVPMQRVDRLAWALATPALWATGWSITSQVIVDADRHHAVFGSSGALVVSALAGLLHIARRAEENGSTVRLAAGTAAGTRTRLASGVAR